MASSSVILTGPCPYATKASVKTARIDVTARTLGVFRAARLCFKGRLRFGEFVAISGDPNVQGRQQNDAHGEGRDQTADDYDRERALGVGADGVRKSGRYQTEGCDQHGHHDGAKA